MAPYPKCNMKCTRLKAGANADMLVAYLAW